MTNIDVKKYASELLSMDNILILTHAHPDGDTIGTGMGLLRALTNLEKKAILACSDELPHHIGFMKAFADSEKCFFGRAFSDAFVPEYVVSVDIASTALIGSGLSEYASKIYLALDHHDVNTLECDMLFVEPHSSSAGETMYYAIRELEKQSGKRLIDGICASALYAAISSDSGNFKYSCTASRTMHAAGELIEAGADNGEIARQLFDIKTLDSFRAEALCTKNVRFFCDGKVAVSYTDHGLNKEYGLEESDFDTCVQLLRMIEGVEVAVFAKEKSENKEKPKFRLSLRSNTYADVAQVCASFDGGGHKKAAGCTVYGDISEVTEKIVTELSKIVK